MEVIKAKLSSKYQITLPRRVRQALGLQPGDTVVLVVSEDTVKLRRAPKTLTEYMEGLGKEVWASLGGSDKYLDSEREQWDSKIS